MTYEIWVTVPDPRVAFDGIAALQRRQKLPAGFERSRQGCGTAEGAFDVNGYFTVLDHLSMEPGYVLDYVWGFNIPPLLYARPENSPSLRTLGQYMSHVYRDRADGVDEDWGCEIAVGHAPSAFLNCVHSCCATTWGEGNAGAADRRQTPCISLT